VSNASGAYVGLRYFFQKKISRAIIMVLGSSREMTARFVLLAGLNRHLSILSRLILMN